MRRYVALLTILSVTISPALIAHAQAKFPCRAWLGLVPFQKVHLIDTFIGRKKKEKVILRLPAKYYIEELDTLIQVYVDTQDEKALNAPMNVMIQTVAAMEGDWGNGEDPLEHARKFMGKEQFDTFKKVHPEKYKRLVEKSHEKNRP